MSSICFQGQNVVVVSGAWRSGPASDRNLKSFPGGRALAMKRGKLASPGQPGLPRRVVGASWCTVGYRESWNA